jgi:antitoxin FitA
MPKTIQIRNIEDEVYAGLQRHAAAAGLTVPEFLRREAERIAALPTREETIRALDEIRGPWPDADR